LCSIMCLAEPPTFIFQWFPFFGLRKSGGIPHSRKCWEY
jgi:hypothetical protein